MSRRRHWLLIIAGALVLLTGGRMGLRYLDWQAPEAGRAEAPPAPATASQIDEARLQNLATAACRCTRSKGDASEGECWQDYKAATAPFAVSGVASACAPVSTELDCIASDTGETCIVTGYNVNAASSAAPITALCTAGEAQAVEQAYQQGWLGPDGKAPDPQDSADWDAANNRVNAAVDAVLARIARGESVTASSPVTEGCTS
jgi:hypothetical protein